MLGTWNGTFESASPYKPGHEPADVYFNTILMAKYNPPYFNQLIKGHDNHMREMWKQWQDQNFKKYVDKNAEMYVEADKQRRQMIDQGPEGDMNVKSQLKIAAYNQAKAGNLYALAQMTGLADVVPSASYVGKRSRKIRRPSSGYKGKRKGRRRAVGTFYGI